MKIYGSNIPFVLPARTFIVAGSVASPEAAFAEALQKAKFRITSKPGESPLVLRHGTLATWIAADSIIFSFLPEKYRRWELSIQALIAVERDHHGHHAVTVTGQGIPARGNDYLFEVVAGAADVYAKDGLLLHVSDYFQGDPKTLKKQGRTAK